MKHNLVSIGLRAKTGRAIVVVLGGSIDALRVVSKLELGLTDPEIPTTSHPYHEVMNLPWADSERAVRKSAAAIAAIAREALAGLIKKLNGEGMKVYGVGTVGAKDRDLARIGNYHIRAHAAEGLLFRQVLDLAAAANGLKRRTFPDRDLEEIATAELGLQSAVLKDKLNDLGRLLDAPWRADEKQAATAAWLVLNAAQTRRIK